MHAEVQPDSGQLLCPACGYELAGLLPDEKDITDCPECGRLAITLDGLREEEGQERQVSLARRWLILGALQGVVAAISIHVFLFSTYGPGPTASPITGAGMRIIVPATLVFSGVCGGFWIRYNTPGARRWDYILSVIAFMVLWLPVTFLVTMLLFLVPF